MICAEEWRLNSRCLLFVDALADSYSQNYSQSFLADYSQGGLQGYLSNSAAGGLAVMTAVAHCIEPCGVTNSDGRRGELDVSAIAHG